MHTWLYKHLKLTKSGQDKNSLSEPKLLRDSKLHSSFRANHSFVFSIKHLYFVHYTERWKHPSPFKKSQTVNMKGLALRTHTHNKRQGKEETRKRLDLRVEKAPWMFTFAMGQLNHHSKLQRKHIFLPQDKISQKVSRKPVFQNACV